jgi:hypothetical protein
MNGYGGITDWLSTKGLTLCSTSDRRFYYSCPFCFGHSKLSFDAQWGSFLCFRCYEGYHCRDIWPGRTDLVGMVMLLEHVPYWQALLRVESLVGRSYAPTDYAPCRLERPDNIWPKGSRPLEDFSDEGCPARRLLSQRGIPHLMPYARYSIEYPYRDRLLLEHHWFGSTPQGFEAKRVYSHQQPKTLYPPWFRTGEHLYGTRSWDWAKPFAVITESILDAETLGTNAVGLFGSSLKESQFELLLGLRQHGTRDLIWFLDGDALRKSLGMLLRRSTLMFFTNWVVRCPLGEDPNSLGHSRAWGLVSQATQVSNEEDALPLLLESGL